MRLAALILGAALVLPSSAVYGQRVDDLPGPPPLSRAAVDSVGNEGREVGVEAFSPGERAAGAAMGAVAGAAAGWLAYRFSLVGLFSDGGAVDEERERRAMLAGAVIGAIVGAIRGSEPWKGERGRGPEEPQL